MTREEREDAIDIIQLILDKYEEDECLVTEMTIGDEDIKAFKMAIEVLEQEPRWIPVSERLPTNEEYIANNGLFIVTDGNRTYAEYFDVYNSMKYFGEPTMNGFRVDRCVIAWMPLPKPYEPQESEE
jgi:hypothetical protein